MRQFFHKKIEFTKKIVGDGLLYHEIQSILNDRFESGISNSTLKRMGEDLHLYFLITIIMRVTDYFPYFKIKIYI